MTKRRRSTDRHRLAVVILAALAIGALVIPAASYTTAELSRSGSITVGAIRTVCWGSGRPTTSVRPAPNSG